ncbi:GNAT family N-acetyltransferase [Corallococcus sp. AS-1-12]|uniref:GNAT family N-acetyltransferase n=1 Tax=Corallococcus sp. AS-1-12 TaxID=2874598 RepID=UPI001CBDBB86|nr:hypothetical protein [Corallococcus sp. AS-1-12]MBZ4334726.1 hypothetical protein [Corallococcus sp. AS-1-12]
MPTHGRTAPPSRPSTTRPSLSAPPPSEAEGAGFHKLTSRVFATNVRSRALLKRLGFREVGVHEKHAPLDGVWHDVVVVEKLLLANVR